MPARRHPAFIFVIGQTHRLVVLVVPDHGKHGNAVASLGPKTGCAVHDRAVADGADDLPVGCGQLRPGRSTDAPTEAGTRVPDIRLLVLPEAEVEGVVAAGEILADYDGVGIERARHDAAEFVGMDRLPAAIARCRRAGLRARFRCRGTILLEAACTEISLAL